MSTSVGNGSDGAPALQIRPDDLSGPQIRAMLEEHLQHMRSIGPPESVHALELDELRAPDLSFWCAWRGEQLAGCGALKRLDAGHAEIKSMRTAAAARRSGVAAAMLAHLIEQAKARGLRQLSLETGSMIEFEPARQLYQRFGFVDCEPFADYLPDPASVFMTLRL